MATRATWKGVLQISLVTIPIKVYPATESSEGLSFNQLHAECQTRMQQKRWCSTCSREVPAAEIVKGFEFEKGKYVVLLEEELDAVTPPSAKVIDLVSFAPATTLPRRAIQRAYFLEPDGAAAARAYALMEEGMAGKVGIGKLAIYGREYLVAVEPQPEGLMLYTLHHAAEWRTPPDLSAILAHEFSAAEMMLARRLVAGLTGPLHLAEFTDEYRLDLRRLIDAKIAGSEILVPMVALPPVVDLHEALTQSLEALRATKTKPAKVAAAGASGRPRAQTRRCS